MDWGNVFALLITAGVAYIVYAQYRGQKDRKARRGGAAGGNRPTDHK